jgi:hypothetical protein
MEQRTVNTNFRLKAFLAVVFLILGPILVILSIARINWFCLFNGICSLLLGVLCLMDAKESLCLMDAKESWKQEHKHPS